MQVPLLCDRIIEKSFDRNMLWWEDFPIRIQEIEGIYGYVSAYCRFLKA